MASQCIYWGITPAGVQRFMPTYPLLYIIICIYIYCNRYKRLRDTIM